MAAGSSVGFVVAPEAPVEGGDGERKRQRRRGFVMDTMVLVLGVGCVLGCVGLVWSAGGERGEERSEVARMQHAEVLEKFSEPWIAAMIVSEKQGE